MSIIFQMFRADDLNTLTPQQLDEFRDIIRSTLADVENPALDKTLRDFLREDLEPAQRALQASIQALPEPDQEPITREVTDVLRKRARDVFHQLTSRPPNEQPAGLLDLSQPLLPQLLSREDHNWLEHTSPAYRLLRMAISCEVTNFNFYNALRSVKGTANDAFRYRAGGQYPKDPDSQYSPFNPDNPLYEGI
jgi:hypothetical protein